jgi:hypothetical protein
MGLDIWARLEQVGLLTGVVYDGYPPNEDCPLPGVELTLYGSNNSGVLDQILDRSTTDEQGRYRLRFLGGYDYYSIVEEELPDFVSSGASSPEGDVLTNDWIQFTGPAPGLNHTDNKFWDAYLVSVEPGAPLGGPLKVSAAWPNPSRESVALSLQGGTGGAISLEVLDISGRVVCRMSGPRPASGRLIWDGRSEDGRLLPSGVYHLRVRDGVSEVIRRAVVLR